MIIPIMSVALLAFGLICRKDKNMKRIKNVQICLQYV